MKNYRSRILLLSLVSGLWTLVGCGRETSTTSTPPPPTSASSVDGSKYLLNEEPDGAEGVIKVRGSAKDGDDILIVGRIGSGEVPWIEGRAAFSIVDASLKSCAEIGSDNCPKPWDYC